MLGSRQEAQRGPGSGGAGALSERSFQCRASPSVFWQGARARAPHTRTKTGMSVYKQGTHTPHTGAVMLSTTLH